MDTGSVDKVGKIKIESDVTALCVGKAKDLVPFITEILKL
jgi:hypothetical protein